MTSLNREQSRAVDRQAQEQLGIPGEVLMENAGGYVARSTLQLAGELGCQRVVVLAGPGNNGGDGFVVTRQLLDRIDVRTVLVGNPERLKGDALANHARLLALDEAPLVADRVETVERELATAPSPLVVDGLFGTGLSRDVEGLPRQVIEAVVRAGHPVLAIDLPSGLDCDTGVVLGAAIRAVRTVTFVAAKPGFFLGQGPELCGQIEVVPIGFPEGRLMPD